MNTTLNTEARSGRGKNHARLLRRNGQVPGIVYGESGASSGAGSVALSVDPDAISRILKSESGVNTLIWLAVDSGEPSQVLIKDYQVNPITHALLHVDFYRVAMDKAITVTVPIELQGEAEGVKVQGGLIEFVQREIAVECLPSEIPEHITVDVSPLTIGQSVRVGDLLEGTSWRPVADADTLLVHVIAPKVEEEEEEEEETVEEDEAAAEAPTDDQAQEQGAKSGA